MTSDVDRTKFKHQGEKRKQRSSSRSANTGRTPPTHKNFQNKSSNGRKRFDNDSLPFVRHNEDLHWFDYQINFTFENGDTLSSSAINQLLAEADELLQKDIENYNKSLKSGKGDDDGEGAWLLSAVKKGTASDRMTAMQLQIHKSPVHAIEFLDGLVAMLDKKVTREAMEVIPIIVDVFKNIYLPPSRKLIPFHMRPLKRIDKLTSNDRKNRSKTLVLWIFEHKLKLIYSRLIRSLETISSGVVVDLAKKALKAALDLLVERPEAEQQLLSLLVNKLGHSNAKIGSFVTKLMEELSRKQPAMRSVIVKEVERLVYRKNVSERAHLYAISFLSQMMLRPSDSDIAVHLLGIYFGLFKTVIAHKDSSNRVLKCLLSAANRAIPFAKEKAEKLAEDIDALYKVVHMGSFPIAVQTLKLLHQIQLLSDNLSDRFYTVLYRKLYDQIPQKYYNQLMLLLFKALQTDSCIHRVRTFVKRLLQIALISSPPLAAGILILISRLSEAQPSLIVLKKEVIHSERALATLTVDDDEEEHFVDYDVDGKPITKTEDVTKNEDAKVTIDVGKETNAIEHKNMLRGSTNSLKTSGWVHSGSKHSDRTPYDPTARNPLFVNCERIADSELLLLSSHYHPSVAVFARQLLEGKRINYRGDPLIDFTMMSFLDRFAYKNPKEKTTGSRGGITTKKKSYDPWGVKKMKVMSKEYVNMKSSELPPDERYLHRFAQLQFKEKPSKEEQDEWEYSSVASDEFDAILEKFEPGDLNDCFDIDFGKEFSAEKKKKGAEKRPAEEEVDIDEEVENDLDDIDMDDEIDDYEDEEDDENVDMESDEDDERAFQKTSGNRNAMDFDDDSADEIGDGDFETAADNFGALLEEYDEDSRKNKKPQVRGGIKYKFKKRRT